MYSQSIEEHQYLSALKREKKAFEDLIHKKATLVISLPDHHLVDSETATDSQETGGVVSDSRMKRAAGEKAAGLSTIVVDIREFGSSLPSSLHLHGFDIQPVTLAVSASPLLLRLIPLLLPSVRSVITFSLLRSAWRGKASQTSSSLSALVGCSRRQRR
jgi:hypothetical protein